MRRLREARSQNEPNPPTAFLPPARTACEQLHVRLVCMYCTGRACRQPVLVLLAHTRVAVRCGDAAWPLEACKTRVLGPYCAL